MFVCLEKLTLLKLCAFSFLCGPRAYLYPFYEGFIVTGQVIGFRTSLLSLVLRANRFNKTYMDIISEVSLFLFKSLHIRELQKQSFFFYTNPHVWKVTGHHIRACAACVISFPSFLLVASARQRARKSSRVRTFGTSYR